MSADYITNLPGNSCCFNINRLAPYKSVKGCGQTGPNMEQSITLVNGAKVPVGTRINYQYWEDKDGDRKQMTPSLSYNEYIIYDVSQVRMRYLVQVSPKISINQFRWNIKVVIEFFVLS